MNWLLIYEFITLSFLLLAGLTGVWALNSLKDAEKSYSFLDLFRRDIKIHRNPSVGKFLVYFTLVSSTFGAFLAVFLRIMWLKDVGWDMVGHRWGYWWLTSHLMDGITFSAVHILVCFRQMRMYGDRGNEK